MRRSLRRAPIRPVLSSHRRADHPAESSSRFNRERALASEGRVVRYIQMVAEPQELSLFRAALRRANPSECDLYDTYMDSVTHAAIVEACLSEQQRLCVYTGMTASSDNVHVEHVVARSVSCPKNPPVDFVGRPFQTIEWRNLVACIPRDASSCPYGAGRKGSWPSDSEQHLFISPLHPSCESKFRYGKQGSVRPANEADEAATKTIEHLG